MPVRDLALSTMYKDVQCVILVERLVRTEPVERLYRFPTSDILARVYFAFNQFSSSLKKLLDTCNKELPKQHIICMREMKKFSRDIFLLHKIGMFAS